MSGLYGMPETVLSFVRAGSRPARRFGKYVGAHIVRPRAGLGPAPTDIPERSRFFVGAAISRLKAFPLQGGRPIPPVRGKWPKAKRGREARPKVVTDEGAPVARAPRSSHGQLPAATQGRHTGPPLLAHRQNED